MWPRHDADCHYRVLRSFLNLSVAAKPHLLQNVLPLGPLTYRNVNIDMLAVSNAHRMTGASCAVVSAASVEVQRCPVNNPSLDHHQHREALVDLSCRVQPTASLYTWYRHDFVLLLPYDAHQNINKWLGGVTVRTLDLQSRGHVFDPQLDRYQVITTWMGDCHDRQNHLCI